MHCVSVHTNIWIGCCVRALVHDESTKLPNDSHPVYTHPYMSAPVITTFTGGPPLSPPRSHTHRSPPGSAGLPVEVRGHRRRINDKKARDRAAPPGGPAGRGCSDVSPPPSAHTSALTSGRFFMLIHAWLDVWAQVIVYTITRRPNKTRSHWLQKDIDCGWRNTAGGAPPHLSCLFISKDPLRRWWAQMCGNDPGVHVIWRRFAAAASSYGGFY